MFKINVKACALLTTFALMTGCSNNDDSQNPIFVQQNHIEKIDTKSFNTINNANLNDTSESTNLVKKVDIKINFAGDCTLGNDKKVNYFNEMVIKQNNDYSYFFKNVKDIFQNDDYTLVNLETTFTNATDYSEKQFNFKGPTEYVEILKTGNVEGVNISNNHSKDYLEEGYQDTIDTLENNNIDYSGDEYIHIEEIKGIKVGFIGFKNANLTYENIDDKLKLVKENGAQLIIASCHWGIERENQFNDNQQEIGHYLIDNGADVVIGHHPHVLQGIEEYNNKYIVYSLGNFCFGGNQNPKDKDSMIFSETFSFENGKLTATQIEIIPCSISSTQEYNNFQPTPLRDEEKDRIIEKIKKYSYNFNY